MDTPLALITGIIYFGVICLTPFLFLFLALGWANLISRYIRLFVQRGNNFSYLEITAYLHIPFLAVALVITLLMLKDPRIGAPFKSFWIINMGPLWWTLAVLGLFVIGAQNRSKSYQNVIRLLFLLAGTCYTVSLLLSLVGALFNNGYSASATNFDAILLPLLNTFSILTFFAASVLSFTMKSWRAVFMLLGFIAIAVILLNHLIGLYPFPAD